MEKKGVDVMIGYVLLIVFTLVIGAVVFIFLRSYVPSEKLDCPKGVEAYINELSYDNSTLLLTVDLKNSGTFDIAGYFIHATNNSSQETATIDLSSSLEVTSASKKSGNSVIFGPGGNFLSSGKSRKDTFNVSQFGKLYSVSIIPVRYQEENNRERFVSCSDGEVKQIVEESAPFVAVCPNNNQEGSEVCDGTDLNGQSLCSGLGLGYTGGSLSCLPDCSGYDTTQCTSYLCGNGIIEPANGETCDQGGGNVANGDGCSSSCQVEFGWDCSSQPSVCTRLLTTLFYDNFEGYSVRYGPVFFSEMDAHGWYVDDVVDPIPDDDIYLNTTQKYQGVYSVLVQDDAELLGNISTLGYNNITFNYSRRTLSLESNEFFRIGWRIGNSGNWNPLENVSSNSWANATWPLPVSAANQPLIQVRFFLDTTQPGGGGNSDHGLADNVNVTGKVL